MNFQILKSHYLYQCISPFSSRLALACALSVVGSAVFLLNPWLAGQVASTFVGEESLLPPKQIILLWLIVLITQAGLMYVSSFILSTTSEKILCQLREKLFRKLQSLPLPYFEGRQRGEVLSLMTNDTLALSQFFSSTLVSTLPSIFTFLGAFILMFLLNPSVGLAIAVVAPLFVLLVKLLGRNVRQLSYKRFEYYSHNVAIAEENLRLISLIKSFGLESREQEKLAANNEQLIEASNRYYRHQLLLGPISQCFGSAAVVLILWFVINHQDAVRLSAAEMVSLLLYGLLLIRPASSLASVYGLFENARAAMDRLEATFDHADEIGEAPEQIINVPKRGNISFTNVEFAYAGKSPILRELNLQLNAGETIAIIGRNGIGKSTVARLLMRFIQPTAGTISANGRNIEEFDIVKWRRQIGYVQQEVQLFNTSIRENITVGVTGATDSELQTIAEAVDIWEFIVSLPQGLDTVVGDQGVLLSGGQRQRLALARALLPAPALLILDEATAMFDPESERLYVENCKRLLMNSTVVLITHRPASLALASHIYRLKGGRLLKD